MSRPCKRRQYRSRHLWFSVWNPNGTSVNDDRAEPVAKVSQR